MSEPTQMLRDARRAFVSAGACWSCAMHYAIIAVDKALGEKRLEGDGWCFSRHAQDVPRKGARLKKIDRRGSAG